MLGLLLFILYTNDLSHIADEHGMEYTRTSMQMTAVECYFVSCQSFATSCCYVLFIDFFLICFYCIHEMHMCFQTGRSAVSAVVRRHRAAVDRLQRHNQVITNFSLSLIIIRICPSSQLRFAITFCTVNFGPVLACSFS